VRTAILALILAAGCSRSDAEVDRLLAELRAGGPEGRALADLGPAHADGIPAILAAMEADDRRSVLIPCLEALLSMEAGEQARPAVEKALQNRDPLVADRAALVEWKLFNGRNPGLDRLVERAPADLNARLQLRRAPPLPPALAGELAANADLAVLAALGPTVRAALPRIERALESGSADERIRAAEAHFAVSGRLQPALGVLKREFEVENLFLRQRIHAIWLEMLAAEPGAMRAELRTWQKSGPEPLRIMATQMLRE
jgi:hypothetical protein